MPTIAIATEPLPAGRKRAIALRLTRWLADRGVDQHRVVVRFEPTWDVYRGGWPVAGRPPAADGLPHAAVTCCVGPERDEDFRAALAGHIAATLGVTGFLYLEYRTTSPSDVYVLAGGALTRADRPTSRKEETP